MSHISAEFYRGAVEALDRGATSPYGRDLLADYRALLAEAEAREGSVPTAADIAVADELDMLAAHIQQYISQDDARDDIRRICRNRAADLRRGVKRGPTAAEVIAAAERALEKLLRSTNTIEVLGEYEALEINTSSRRTMRAHVEAVIQESRDALAAIDKWKEAQRLLEGQGWPVNTA
jgi:hypothetical protein